MLAFSACILQIFTFILKSIAIVILNYNGLSYLQKFLPEAIRLTPLADVVVADNASVDGSVGYLQNMLDQKHIIQIPHNKGFCGGYNYALQKLKGYKYFVLLNSDVKVTKNWLEPLIAHLEKHTVVAACQPKILSYHALGRFEYAGAGGGMIDYLGYPFARGRIFDYLEKDKGQYDDNTEIFWATGACMCIRAHLFKQYLLDPLFFAHMEEIDLCWRLKSAGYSIQYIGNSIVYHIGGGTLDKDNARKTYYNFRNNLFLLYQELTAITFVFRAVPALAARWCCCFQVFGNGQC